MEDVMVPIFVCAMLFIGLPWLIFHYVTKWKQAPKITQEDEQLLDDLFNLARRLEERLATVERIAAADHPDWKPGLPAPSATPGEWRSDMTGAPRAYSIDRRN